MYTRILFLPIPLADIFHNKKIFLKRTRQVLCPWEAYILMEEVTHTHIHTIHTGEMD